MDADPDPMHPSQRLRGLKSRHLDGRKIVLGVSGSIAAVETVRIAHELIRHGADVQAVLTPSAVRMIGVEAVEYATGHAPILQLTGRGEHIELCGRGQGGADLLLIAPATANTIAKMSLGIDDTALTSCATVAIGAGLPVVLAPAMHEVMGRHPAVERRLRELERMGVTIVSPRIEEEKAKIADPGTLADTVIHRLAKGTLRGANVLVISGSTAEPLDPVRVLTNRSTGRLGVELAVEAYRRGARVDLWNAWGAVPLPATARVRRFQTVHELVRLLDKYDASRFDVILVPAALSDFAPTLSRHKIPTDEGPRTTELKPLPKVLPRLRRDAPDALLVGFKAESDATKLLARARERMVSTKADLFFANTSQAFGAAEATAWIVAPEGRPRKIKGSKTELARLLLEEVSKRLPRGG